MKTFFISMMTVALLGSSAWAGECKIKTAREACPGKETEALKPYDGKKETEEKKDVADEAACSAWAEKSVKIVRKGTLASKKITASFGGKDLGKSFEDKKECK